MTKHEMFEILSNDFLDLVGGSRNITNLTHCMTRLRINVADTTAVDVKKIESYEGVIGTKWAENQLQIIIGQSVPDLYKMVAEKYEAAGANGSGSKENVPVEGAKKKISVTGLLETLSGCIVPCLPILIGAGLIKVIVLVLEMAGILASGSPTDTVLTFVGDAGFYFFPVFIGYTSAKKLDANPMLGMFMGAILIHPTFITAVAEGTPLAIYGIKVASNNYASSVFPIILTVAVMAPIERFIAKHSPDVLRVMLEPVLTILITLPLSLCILAPLGSYIGNYLQVGVTWLYETAGFAGVGLFAAFYPLLVMTGMHLSFIPYLSETLARTGVEGFFVPAALIASILQGIACLAVALKTKDKSLKGISISSTITALFSGVFEPALFGISLPHRKVLYSTMIGGAVGGAIAGFGRSVAYALPGTTGLVGALPTFLPGGADNMFWICTGLLVGSIVTFALTYISFKDEEDEEAAERKEESEVVSEEARVDFEVKTDAEMKAETIVSPLSGQTAALTEVADEVFASEAMGKGIAIKPENKVVNTVYSPVDGIVNAAFETGHAYGLVSSDGAEVLIHIGIDTVSMNGKGFVQKVKADQAVKKGDVLGTFDSSEITKAGFDDTVMVIITNTNDYSEVNAAAGVSVKTGDNLIEVN